jgi:hypothetical protein
MGLLNVFFPRKPIDHSKMPVSKTTQTQPPVNWGTSQSKGAFKNNPNGTWKPQINEDRQEPTKPRGPYDNNSNGNWKPVGGKAKTPKPKPKSTKGKNGKK